MADDKAQHAGMKRARPGDLDVPEQQPVAKSMKMDDEFREKHMTQLTKLCEVHKAREAKKRELVGKLQALWRSGPRPPNKFPWNEGADTTVLVYESPEGKVSACDTDPFTWPAGKQPMKDRGLERKDCRLYRVIRNHYTPLTEVLMERILHDVLKEYPDLEQLDMQLYEVNEFIRRCRRLVGHGSILPRPRFLLEFIVFFLVASAEAVQTWPPSTGKHYASLPDISHIAEEIDWAMRSGKEVSSGSSSATHEAETKDKTVDRDADHEADHGQDVEMEGVEESSEAVAISNAITKTGGKDGGSWDEYSNQCDY
ncbi:hypothetical protein BJ170DRAFT_679600 [Xylariales sp. AK1849]|nr:hypothetical protein BJ170DRAFT_679600 [Xylariales sp. AK1849]